MPDDRDLSAARPREIELTTADGLRLEGELAGPASAPAAVLLAHPHPVQGGSMRSLVTSELFRALPAAGLLALRFNFRGVERSEGVHGGGVGERLDILAGIDRLADAAPGVPLVLAGWSFGADVALTILDDRLAGWFLVAPPLRVVPLDEMVAAHDPRPKLLVVGERDPFRPPESARELTRSWTNTDVVDLPGADHFFAGRTDRVASALRDFVSQLRGRSPGG